MLTASGKQSRFALIQRYAQELAGETSAIAAEVDEPVAGATSETTLCISQGFYFCCATTVACLVLVCPFPARGSIPSKLHFFNKKHPPYNKMQCN